MTNFLKNKHLSLSVMILFFAVFCQGYSSIRSNLDIFDSLSQKIAEEFIKENITSEYDTLLVSFSGKNDFLIRKHILSLYNKHKIVLIEKDTSSLPNELQIVTEELKVSMKSTQEKETYIRQINVKYTFFLKIRGIIRTPAEFVEFYQDTVKKGEITQINSEDHPFASAELPEEKQTVFEQIIEPLIIVTTAAITVILLFTIRSN